MIAGNDGNKNDNGSGSGGSSSTTTTSPAPPAGKTPTSNAKNFLYFVASAVALVAIYYLTK